VQFLGSFVIRRLSAIFVLILAVLASTLTGLTPASAGPSESYFTSRINSERGARGLRSYAIRGDLTSVARNHAARMAARRSYYHNPNLSSEVGGWQALAENVGKGSDAGSLHNAFMASSGHRRNILSSTYTEVGVGTATDSSGTLYVVQIFRLPTGGSTYRAPARRATTTTPSTTTRRTTTRASRSAPRVTAADRQRAAAQAAAALRVRVRTAYARMARTPRGSAMQRLVLFHDVTVYIAPR
jgi:hypothetical protein